MTLSSVRVLRSPHRGHRPAGEYSRVPGRLV